MQEELAGDGVRESALRLAQEFFGQLEKDEDWVDELIAERRREAACEIKAAEPAGDPGAPADVGARPTVLPDRR